MNPISNPAETTHELPPTKPSVAFRNGFLDFLADDLSAVEKLLQSELRSDASFVDELLIYVSGLGGKRLRPALLLLAAEATGGVQRQHIVLATVVEMIHIATLVHDDILDEAETRRYRQTINRRWNNESSVLLGDYLFTHAFCLASTLDTTFACRKIGESTNRVCAGELQQVGNRGNLELTETEYYEIINGKTAELCACATHLGAHYAGASKSTSHQLRAYGRDLGIAFQIADDLLDLTGEEASTGKSLGSDLEKQKLTLPLIHALENAPDVQRVAIRRILDQPVHEVSRTQLMELLDENRSLAYARQRALDYSNAATQRLEILEDSKAKETLALLASFAVNRSH